MGSKSSNTLTENQFEIPHVNQGFAVFHGATTSPGITMNHRNTTLLLGTSFLMAIGCSTEGADSLISEMNDMEEAQDVLVELGLNHDNETIVVAFESFMPKELLVQGEPMLIRSSTPDFAWVPFPSRKTWTLRMS